MVSQNAETTVLKDFRNASCYDTTANSPYTSFGIDVAAINDAKNLTCPQGISCGYDSFNAVIVFDFIGGTLLVCGTFCFLGADTINLGGLLCIGQVARTHSAAQHKSAVKNPNVTVPLTTSPF